MKPNPQPVPVPVPPPPRPVISTVMSREVRSTRQVSWWNVSRASWHDRRGRGESTSTPPPPFAPCRRGSGSCHVSSFSGPLRFANLYPRTPLPSPPAGESTSPQHLPTHRVGMFTRLGRYKILIRSLADTSLAPIDGWTHASPSLPAPSCLSPPVPVAHVVPSPDPAGSRAARVRFRVLVCVFVFVRVKWRESVCDVVGSWVRGGSEREGCVGF